MGSVATFEAGLGCFFSHCIRFHRTYYSKDKEVKVKFNRFSNNFSSNQRMTRKLVFRLYEKDSQILLTYD